MAYSSDKFRKSGIVRAEVTGSLVVNSGAGWISLITSPIITLTFPAVVRISFVSHASITAPDSTTTPAVDHIQFRVLRHPGAVNIFTSTKTDLNGLMAQSAGMGFTPVDQPGIGSFSYELQAQVTKTGGSNASSVTFDRIVIQIDERGS